MQHISNIRFQSLGNCTFYWSSRNRNSRDIPGGSSTYDERNWVGLLRMMKGNGYKYSTQDNERNWVSLLLMMKGTG